jgi:hypothetical protein
LRLLPRHAAKALQAFQRLVVLSFLLIVQSSFTASKHSNSALPVEREIVCEKMIHVIELTFEHSCLAEQQEPSFSFTF